MTRRSWKEARRYVLGPLVVGVALVVARRRSGWIALGAASAVTLFFRDPERRLIPDPDTIYAAADGVVVNIDSSISDPWIPNGEAVRISTFLSLHNVHINRSPVAGKIRATKEIQGGFSPALFRHSEANQQNRLAIDGTAGPVVVAQIAGMIVRKISCWVGTGDSVEAGQRIGIIHFGSRTDVVFETRDTEVLVRVGDRVRGGITPLARYITRKESACDSL